MTASFPENNQNTQKVEKNASLLLTLLSGIKRTLSVYISVVLFLYSN